MYLFVGGGMSLKVYGLNTYENVDIYGQPLSCIFVIKGQWGSNDISSDVFPLLGIIYYHPVLDKSKDPI